MARRFLTRSTIEDMIADGSTEYRVAAGDVVTDLAREHARAKGFRLIAPGRDDDRPTSGPAAPASTTPSKKNTATAEVSRQKVRSAVIAALGRVPDGLDALVDKAMKD